MADNNSYSATGHYFPPQQYYPTTNSVDNPLPPVPLAPRPDVPQRKRPKYTRSKTGCMTCRVKKIKCDETKPICTRCTHGSRECLWPEGIPPRRRNAYRRDSLDERPTTAESVAESSGLSESPPSTPRERTPPHRNLADLMPEPSHPSETFAHLHSMDPAADFHTRLVYPQHDGHSFPMTPGGHYITSRYDQPYGTLDTQVARGMIASFRPQHPHQASNYWNSESTDAYYHDNDVPLQERPQPGPTHLNDSFNYRYQ